jgi:hypothetical protein
MTFWLFSPFLITTISIWIFFHIHSIGIIFHYLYYNNLCFMNLALPNICVNNHNSFQECLWDSCIVPRNWKNLKFRLNVWKHTINNYGFIFFQSSISLFFPPHFIILGAKSIRSRVALQQKVSLCAKWFH